MPSKKTVSVVVVTKAVGAVEKVEKATPKMKVRRGVDVDKRRNRNKMSARRLRETRKGELERLREHFRVSSETIRMLVHSNQQLRACIGGGGGGAAIAEPGGVICSEDEEDGSSDYPPVLESGLNQAMSAGLDLPSSLVEPHFSQEVSPFPPRLLFATTTTPSCALCHGVYTIEGVTYLAVMERGAPAIQDAVTSPEGWPSYGENEAAGKYYGYVVERAEDIANSFDVDEHGLLPLLGES